MPAARLRLSWLAAWAAAMAVWAVQATTGWLDPLEQRWSDWTQSAVPVHPAPEIVVVAIDDASLAALGEWPWSREIHARLIDRLSATRAKLVVSTVPFVGSESRQALAELQRIASAVTATAQSPEYLQLLGMVQQSQELLDADGRLVQSLAQNQHTLVVVGENANGQVEWPLARVSATALGVGHLRLERDGDGLVRRHALLLHAGDRSLPSLALWMAAQQRGQPVTGLQWSAAQAGMTLGGQRWPTDPGGHVRPLWRSDSAERPLFVTISAAQLAAGAVPASKLEGRMVLIGATSPAIAKPVQLAGGVSLAPVQALAQLASGLLTQRLIATPPWSAKLSFAALLACLAYLAWVVPRLAMSSAVATTALLSVLLLSASHLVMVYGLTTTPVILALICLWSGHAAGLVVTRWPRGRAAQAADSLSGLASSGSRPDAQVTLAAAAGIEALEELATVPAGLALQETPATAPYPAVSAATTTPPIVRSAGAARPTAAIPLAAFAPIADQPAAVPWLPAESAVSVDAKAGRPPRGRLPRLGRFQLEREIGRGSMGRVYLAHTVDTHTPVAVKTLALAREFDGFALHEARTRFQREALAALRLHHPDIVRVLDAGEDQGYAWIAMDLLEGRDLAHYTQPGALLPVPEVLTICARVAGALAHAHAQGVIHRDIKPANVMIEPGSGQVKVTDFGIARITDAARTRTGLVLGSPSYMSPEQLAGRDVDGRSDLYSLGVVLFQLLTGRLPAQGHSMAALMHAVAHQTAPDVRSLRPRLPEVVANVVALALEKRAELRYAHAAELEADLRRVAALWGRPHAPIPAATHFSPPETVQEVATHTRLQEASLMVAGTVGHNLSR
ncbi:MAG: CHASE2 domain-containing protein [Burkholderiales bacterium]